MKNDEKIFLTVKEFADFIGVHYNTVRNMIKSGHLDAFTIGTGRKKCYRIPKTEVNRMAEINLKGVVNELVKNGIKNEHE